MNSMGFNLLSQEEKRKKGKTFMDYAPGHVGDDNYVTTQPTIISNTSTNTTTANKSGTTKNTATIAKEPKRKPFSWADDDPFNASDDRSFLEGFYEVDSAISDLEREERMSQVDKALKDIRNRRAGDMLRNTKDIFQPINYSVQNASAPRAEFHAAPAWFSPLEKSTDDVVNAGREHAVNIVDDKFNQGWLYALGKENIYDYSSPVYNSRYKDVLIDSVTDNAKADFVAFAGASLNPIRDIVYNSIENYGMTQKSGYPPIDIATLGASILAGATQTFVDDNLEGAKNTYNDLRNNNARAAQSQRQYEYLNNSEFKYLVDDEKAREKFINTLLSEVENIQNTEQFGYLQPDVNKKYKEEAIRAIMRIVYLNQNYDKYSAERDAELRKLLRNK